MSSSSASEVASPVQTLFHNVLSSSSSEEPPMEEWSSLRKIVITDNPKVALFSAGLYDPGSGNICTKYIPLSDSEVFKHPYYKFPGVKDPGIFEALLGSEDQKVYPQDGQELYLDLCKEMNVIPVRKFHRGMLGDNIDLKYYGVNPVGIRAMSMALSFNRHVRRLDLTGNALNDDACYHLGKLLGESAALRELVLAACRIQPEGMRRLTAFISKRAMDLLDLSKNRMGDLGFQYLAYRLEQGTVVKRLNLSLNDLGTDSALAFAKAIEFKNTITHLDLSWNNLSSPNGIKNLILQLSLSKVLVELNLAWNALNIGRPLRNLFIVPTLQIIDLSNNRLSTPAAKEIALKLQAAKHLDILDLSFNPLTPSDAFTLLNKMGDKEVRLKHLLMEDVNVEKEFVQELNKILALDQKRTLKVTYGKVLRDYTLPVSDIRSIILMRMDFLTSRATKKCRLDTALYFLQKFKERELMQPREILREMKMAGAPVDEDLVTGLAMAFPGPRTDKGGMTIKLGGIVDMIQRLWPDKHLPPTPPEPKPSQQVITKDKKVKKKEKSLDQRPKIAK